MVFLGNNVLKLDQRGGEDFQLDQLAKTMLKFRPEEEERAGKHTTFGLRQRQERNDMRIHLTNDEVIHVEELRQPHHGKIAERG